jgi:CRP-like cAMP-binding protein
MNEDDLRRLESVGAKTEMAAGRVLIERGQYGGGLYVILDGTVVVEAESGPREFGPGTVVGERALFSAEGKRTARVLTKSDVRMLAVDRVAFEQLCESDPELATRVSSAAG